MCAMLPLTQVLRGGGRRERQGPQTEGDGGGQGLHCCTGPRKKHKKGKEEAEERVENFYSIDASSYFFPTPNSVLGSSHNNTRGFLLNPDVSLDRRHVWQGAQNKAAAGAAQWRESYEWPLVTSQRDLAESGTSSPG